MGAAFAAASPAARAATTTRRQRSGSTSPSCASRVRSSGCRQTEMTQPALTATSIACLPPSARPGSTADFVIGHSVGEYAALVAAEALSADDAMVLVRERGLATAEAARETPGAMAAVIGLPTRRSRSCARPSTASGRPTTTAPGSSSCRARRRAWRR